jgi:hypothetical protein
MFATAWVADKYRIRGPIIAANAMVTIIGLAMMGWAPGIPAQYAGVFFTCAGANSNIPHMMSWQANNIRGQWKRAFCSATLVAFGGIGGIAGSLVFRYVLTSLFVHGFWVRSTVFWGSGFSLSNADYFLPQTTRRPRLQTRALGLHDWLADHHPHRRRDGCSLLLCQQEAGAGFENY